MSITKAISSSKNTAKNSSSLKSTPTIIARDVCIEGEIRSTGLIEVEGKINGTINGNAVVIRESGYVEGTITAESVIVKGEINGNLNAKSVSVTSKAKVVGNIDYGSLSVEDGACIDGSFKKIPKES